MSISDRAVLWHDETVHPGSTAMHLAMQAVQADLGLVSEWQEHCQENYESGDWISYADWLEVELEITLEHFVNVGVLEATQLASRVKTITNEISKGIPTGTKILRKPEPPRDPVPLDVRVRIPGSFTAKLAVHEENIELQQWTFEPSASSAGYGGTFAHVDDVFDASGEPLSAPERESTEDFLNVEDTAGPFWAAVQEYLSNTFNGAIKVNWEE